MQNLHLGTIGWSYNFWKGKFYPNKTASKDYLAYYATQFNTVEVDSTFYRNPNPANRGELETANPRWL